MMSSIDHLKVNKKYDISKTKKIFTSHFAGGLSYAKVKNSIQIV